WNAAEWVDEAVATSNCQLLAEAQVTELIIENKKVTGVRGQIKGRPFTLQAARVVLAAGGIGTPLLLKRAGLTRAGDGIGMDTTLMVYGAAKFPGNGNEPPMTYEWANDDPEQGGYL